MILVNDEDEPKYFCWTCRDEPNGWRPFWCPGRGKLYVHGKPDYERDAELCQCGRDKDHVPHPFVDRCDCWNSNPERNKYRERFAAFRARKD